MLLTTNNSNFEKKVINYLVPMFLLRGVSRKSNPIFWSIWSGEWDEQSIWNTCVGEYETQNGQVIVAVPAQKK